MKKTRKASFVLVLSIVFALSLSVTALAASANGRTKTTQLGSRTYSGYNNIVINGNDVVAGTSVNCNVSCTAGQLTVKPIIQNASGSVMRSVTVSNTSTTSGLYATTGSGQFTPDAGTYYSGGHPCVYNDASGNNSWLTYYASPSLTVGSRSLSEVNLAASGINEKGQSYGTINHMTDSKNYPDLIRAVGIDGTEGYVYANELFLYDSMMVSEKSAEFMSNKEYIQGRLINLYATDGVTIVGQYLADCLIGVTVVEDTISRTYNADGTILTTYADGTTKTIIWK